MSWLEQKYIGFVANRLQRFTKKNNVYNFRCPLCGDSTKHLNKARGYLYENNNVFVYHCHNCSATLRFDSFLKELDHGLHAEYVRELLKEKYASKSTPEHKEFIEKLATPKFIASTPLKLLKKISQLDADHPAKKYIDSRKIPPRFHHKLFLCPKFKAWTNTIIPGKFANIDKDEPRIIIPFLDEEKSLFGFQGRSFSSFQIRYITIMTENRPKIYGLDDLDKNYKIYVFEGPIDSMFVTNSIATAGGDLTTTLNSLGVPKENIVVIYDNEPRSRETIDKIDKAIDKGYNVCLWMDSIFNDFKDVNEMILKSKQSKINTQNIKDLIDQNTFSGLKAKLNLLYWSKV